eukprot:TRINITY_DN1729_c0_g1_i2.p1 TRINITY_DN1729_c0_g1~~TRINITY_DN1729_c0_g1_i2.p1  ORF type:complete len:350 (+),score=52.13 TRINITY_DN1729_c0_g1_i2:159-1052(+)
MNHSLRDSFSLISQDIIRLIYSFCPVEDQLSLSITCKYFHSFSWFEPSLKSMCLEILLRKLQSSPDFLVYVIEKLGYGWKYIAKCLSRPKQLHDSYRAYISLEEGEIIMGGSVRRPNHLVIGNFEKEPSDWGLDDWIENSTTIFSIRDHVIRTPKFVFLCESKDPKDRFFFSGKRISIVKNKKEDILTLQGTMTWPDGFSHFGMWTHSSNSKFEPEQFKSIEEPTHPKMIECIDNGQCTRFSGVLGPQKRVQRQFLCEHCTNYCRSKKAALPKFLWVIKGDCICTCLLYTSPSPRDA